MRFDEAPGDPRAWCALVFSEPEWDCIVSDYGTHYWRRTGDQWVEHSNSERGGFVLLESVQEWLYENIGYAHNDYWCVDRTYHSDKDLPDLKVDWDATFHQPTFEQRNWRINANVRRLLFRKKDHAMLFKLTFHGIEDGPR